MPATKSPTQVPRLTRSSTRAATTPGVIIIPGPLTTPLLRFNSAYTASPDKLANYAGASTAPKDSNTADATTTTAADASKVVTNTTIASVGTESSDSNTLTHPALRRTAEDSGFVRRTCSGEESKSQDTNKGPDGSEVDDGLHLKLEQRPHTHASPKNHMIESDENAGVRGDHTLPDDDSSPTSKSDGPSASISTVDGARPVSADALRSPGAWAKGKAALKKAGSTLKKAATMASFQRAAKRQAIAQAHAKSTRLSRLAGTLMPKSHLRIAGIGLGAAVLLATAIALGHSAGLKLSIPSAARYVLQRKVAWGGHAEFWRQTEKALASAATETVHTSADVC